jgi:serine protease Do
MKRFLSVVLLVILVFSLSSCVLPVGWFSGGDYLTLEEAQQLISDSMGNGATVVGGDKYEVTVDNPVPSNVAAASIGLLSSVRVVSNFKMNYTQGFGAGVTNSTKDYSAEGAGVIYKMDGLRPGDAYIITNYHVVYDYRANTKNHISSDIDIYLYGMEAEKYAIPATYVGGSLNYDIAVLKVTGSRTLAQSSAVPVTIADSDKVSVLDTAIAIGNPAASGISATVGYVNVDSEYLSMVGADNSTTVSLRVMRIDAAVNSGNSGGGLFNDKGELIGIVNAKMSSSSIDNIGYAIPSNVAKYIADNIIYYCDGTERESVYRTLIGIVVDAEKSYTEYDTESGRVYKKETVVIAEVNKGSAAEGKLLAGDVINSITIDGKKYEVARTHHVVDSMLNARPGSRVVLNITRDGQTLEVEIAITENLLTEYK